MQAFTSELKRLLHYEVIELLATVGRIRVYRGIDSATQRGVTLKTIARDLSDPDVASTIESFQRQASASATLKHPGIVEVYEYGEDAGVAFVASEFVEGCSLRPQARAPVPDAVSLVKQLLDALECAHKQGVLHLAINPSCLLLTSKGQLRVGDFGAVDTKTSNHSYMSPEQLLCAPVDHRADIFAVGVLFYELLTGMAPFPGPPETLVQRVCHETETPPSKVNSNVPGVFDPVCAKALAKAADERYLSAQAFFEAVCQAFQDAFGSPPPDFVSNETVVSLFLASLRGGSRKKRPAEPHAKIEPRVPSRPATPAWEPEILRKVEKQLAVFIGPVARVVVKEAAFETSDLEQLYELAAESLGSPEERKAFLAARGEMGNGSIVAAPTPPGKSFSPDSATLTSLGSTPTPAMQPAESVNMQVMSTPEPEPEPEPEPSAMPAFAESGTSQAEASSHSYFDPEPPGLPEVQHPAQLRQESPVQLEQSKAAKSALDMTSRLEELLGKQPQNLAGYLREKPPEIAEVIHAFVSTVSALADRYAANLKTGGLTPQSICFDKLGKASIRGGPSSSPQGSTLGGVMGSPRYAAPEIFGEKAGAGEAPVAGADIYAIGFMFYEILLGGELFREIFAGQRSDLDWLRWHADLNSKAPALKTLLPDHPAALSELLESMMEKDATARISDLKLILSRLRLIAQQADKTVIARKPAVQVKAQIKSPSPPEKKGRAGLLIFLVLILVLAAGAFFIWQNPGVYRRIVAPFYHPQRTPDPQQPSTQ